jgi:hypothetical protein
MAAYKGNAKGFAGLCDLSEDGLDKRRRGRPLWQQQGGEKPFRLTTAGGDIVGIHDDSIVANGICSKGDRIRLGDQIAVAHLDDGRIFPHGWSDDDTRVRTGIGREQALQQFGREFSRFENRHEVVSPTL